MSDTSASSAHDTQAHEQTSQRRKGTGRGVATLSLIVAIITLIIVLLLRMCGSPTTTVVSPEDCTPGISAYEVWLSVGNEGSVEDFLDALVGEKGADGYTGSDGLAGSDGASAYQLWLDQGNTGTPDDFLDSLIGKTGLSGAAGAAGISAYQLWLDQGNTGSEADFLQWLVGPEGSAGADGTAGADGQSTFELWLEQPGNAGKSEIEFLTSLIGPQGPAGVDGACTVGDTGPAGADGVDGADGKSAFEVWLETNPEGTIEQFFEFISGADGATGATGATGPAGPAGPAGPQGEPGAVTGFGYSGSWYDITDQPFGSSGAKPMLFGETDYQDGVSMVDGSKITFSSPGRYNVQFSAQLSYSSGGTDELANIWLAQNGSTVPDTNTRMLVPGGNDGYVVAAWNFFVNVNAGDYVQLMWNATDPAVEILHEVDTGGTGLYQPGIPSIILTVNQVSGTSPQ